MNKQIAKEQLKNNELINNYTEQQVATTAKNYKTNLITFFSIIQQTPNEFLNLEKKEIKNYIREFITERINHLSPSAYHNSLYAIKGFLAEYEIYFYPEYWKKQKGKKKLKNIGTNATFKKTDIQLLLEYADILERAIILTAISTGLRISTITQLHEKDLKYLHNDNVLTEVTVHSTTTKNKRTHYTFLTTEATNAVNLYLKEKDNYLEQSYKKSKKTPQSKDKILLFPYLPVTIRQKWHRIINKAGYNERDRITKRYLYKFHSLKRFFKTQLTKSNINEKYIDYFSEHLSNLDNTYIDFIESDKEELKKRYKKAEPYLTIKETTTDNEEMKNQIDQLTKDKKLLQKQINDLSSVIKKPEHPDINYLTIYRIIVTPNGEVTFKDFNTDGKQFYIVRDENRINTLKEYYDHQIKQMKKQAKEKNETQTMINK